MESHLQFSKYKARTRTLALRFLRVLCMVFPYKDCWQGGLGLAWTDPSIVAVLELHT